MIDVQFPDPQFRMKKEEGRSYIFDAIRKVWLLLTEEEWVRQNFVQYLIQVLNYPASRIALEKEILVGERKKRFDILVYDGDHQPWMLIECKAPEVSLNEEVLQQVLRYHIALPCKYLIITNGDVTIGWQKQEGSLESIQSLAAIAQ
jgi:hypothetical protein